jgi:hypothetical protein
MKKENIMLIAGCSHSAGAEIDGSQDSPYNRQNSYGNLLAKKLNYSPINISSSGSTNATIARNVLEWCSKNYNADSMNLFVLVSWTESSRMEIPSKQLTWYEGANLSADWSSETSKYFLRINQGWAGGDGYEKRTVPYYQRFIAQNLMYLEVLSANLVLQLQYFLKLHSLRYVMCNTMHMFSTSEYLDFYLNLIDESRYLDLQDPNLAFYWKFKNKGFNNPKAKYWHHNEEPHKLYADELLNFVNKNGI